MQLIIKKEAYLKLKYYIGLVDIEISGMGKSYIEDGNIIMTDLMIFEQTNSSGGTELTEASMAKFLDELMQKNENTSEWNVWWHSHADFGVFWSPTDNATIQQHSNIQSYLISLVGNRKKEYKARLDIFAKDTSPFNYKGIYYKEDLEIVIEKDESHKEDIEKLEKAIEKAQGLIKKYKRISDPKVMEECQSDIDKKVKKKEFIVIDKHSKWSWGGKNQEALSDDFGNAYDQQDLYDPNYGLYADADDNFDYPGKDDNCPLCGWKKAICAEINICQNSKKHQRELEI